MESDLEGFKLGALDAERDPLLADCFIRSTVIEETLSFDNPRSILVGKKGSGKSAVFLMGLGAENHTPTVRISPSTHRISLQEVDLNYRQYADIIEYELALECLRAWAQDQELLEQLGNKEKLSVKGAANSYLERLKEVGERVSDVSAFGFGVGLGEKPESLLDLVTKQDLEGLITSLDNLAGKGARCLILIDDPELLLSASEIPPVPLIGALLFAATDLTYRLSNAVRVVIFLKLHVYQYLRRHFEDIDKLRQNFKMLTWTDEDLTRLLGIRIEKGLEIAKDQKNPWLTLLRGETDISERELQEFMLDRLVSGPRDLIWFASQILDFHNEGLDGWQAVTAAEIGYSNDQLDQVSLQYNARGYDGVADVVLKLFDSEALPNAGEGTVNEFRSYFRKRLRDDELMKQRQRHAWLEALTWRTLAELLFDIGVLGYRSGTADRYILPYETASEKRDFLAAERWRVNPAFHKVLGIN